ncbi:MAG: Na+/H+ antiporter NhaA [Actinobacteria bacterium]|nr:Na+/H+ antiporter NhaA [Actinomycetota bacterium]
MPTAVVQPVLAFMRTEASGGIVMLVAAVAALIWANSPWSASYEALISTHLTLELGGIDVLDHTVQEWVNDALMVIFFFVVGLEIKRELVVGELRDPRAAALPAVAALGGMVAPALIYLAFNAGTPASRGWGIPMATDIAFAIGVVSLVGTRVPISAKLFLLALAIVDDLGAILVIAVFYTADVSVGWLAVAVAGLLLVVVMQRLHVRAELLYLLAGTVVWLGMLESGVHATIAGVALGLLTPTASFYRPEEFTSAARRLVDRVDAYTGHPGAPEDARTTERTQALSRDVERLAHESVSPLHRLEHKLAPWSSFLVVPIFAFANAGVRISQEELAGAVGDSVVVGVFLGLLVGKVIGVTGAAWLAVRLGVARLPHGTGWGQMAGLGLLAGIGFTVALFVTALAFDDPDLVASAKLGIFAASLVAGAVGFAWLRFVPREPRAGTQPGS